MAAHGHGADGQPGGAFEDHPDALHLLVQLYEKSGKPDDAAKYRAQLPAK